MQEVRRRRRGDDHHRLGEEAAEEPGRQRHRHGEVVEFDTRTRPRRVVASVRN